MSPSGSSVRPLARAIMAAVAVLALFLTAPATLAAGPAGGSPTVGYDISYPQCGGPFPSNVAFGIVGVNKGIVFSPNPCLGTGDGPSELTWAGGVNAQLYANTSLGRQQPGDSGDAGSALEAESVTVALAADLREQLAAVERAEERIAQGTYGRSVESGIPIPDARLEAEPLAERTIEEQRLYERHGRK